MEMARGGERARRVRLSEGTERGRMTGCGSQDERGRESRKAAWVDGVFERAVMASHQPCSEAVPSRSRRRAQIPKL